MGKRQACSSYPGRDTSLSLTPASVFLPRTALTNPATRHLAASRLLALSQQDFWHCLDQRGCCRLSNEMISGSQMQNRHSHIPVSQREWKSQSISFFTFVHCVVTNESSVKKRVNEERVRWSIDAIALIGVRRKVAQTC